MGVSAKSSECVRGREGGYGESHGEGRLVVTSQGTQGRACSHQQCGRSLQALEGAHPPCFDRRLVLASSTVSQCGPLSQQAHRYQRFSWELLLPSLRTLQELKKVPNPGRTTCFKGKGC